MFLMNNRSECESLLFRMPPLSGVIDGVTYENNIFMTVGANGTTLSSPDGITWTSRISGSSNILRDVTYGNSTFVVVGHSGTVLTSSDGTTWTSRTSGTSNTLYGVTSR